MKKWTESHTTCRGICSQEFTASGIAHSDLLFWVGERWGGLLPTERWTLILPLCCHWFSFGEWKIEAFVLSLPDKLHSQILHVHREWQGRMSGVGLSMSECTLGSLLGAVGTNLFLNKEPTAGLPSGPGLSNVMVLYLYFLIIWNNNEFSAPVKNSDPVEAGSAVDQSESSLSFMWTWKTESKCLRSERSTSQDAPQIPNSQRIFERMTVISSQFCFTAKHCLLLQGLWTGWLYTHVSVSVWETHSHVEGGWFLGTWMAFWCFTIPGIVSSYQSGIMPAFLTIILSECHAYPFFKGPMNCLVFYASLEGSLFAMLSR